MHFLSVTVIVLMAAAPILAQDVDNNDIPTQCATVCSNLATVSGDCDRAFRDDRDERNCICQATNAEEVIPLCAACIASVNPNNDDNGNDDNDDHGNDDNDVSHLVSRCSFSSTTYDPSITYSQAAMTAATSLSTTFDDSSRTTLTGTGASATAAATSAISSIQSSLSSQAASLSSAVSAASAATATSTDDAAAAPTRGVDALAGVALAIAAAWA